MYKARALRFIFEQWHEIDIAVNVGPHAGDGEELHDQAPDFNL
jgi:hypothetical protein